VVVFTFLHSEMTPGSIFYGSHFSPLHWGSVSIIRLLERIGFILFLKNGLKKFCKKNYKNNLRSNNYEACTAVANILDIMVLENINLSSDRNRATVVVM
jgi:hypothetical protein